MYPFNGSVCEVSMQYLLAKARMKSFHSPHAPFFCLAIFLVDWRFCGSKSTSFGIQTEQHRNFYFTMENNPPPPRTSQHYYTACLCGGIVFAVNHVLPLWVLMCDLSFIFLILNFWVPLLLPFYCPGRFQSAWPRKKNSAAATKLGGDSLALSTC
jgi:hypothetical protein